MPEYCDYCNGTIGDVPDRYLIDGEIDFGTLGMGRVATDVFWNDDNKHYIDTAVFDINSDYHKMREIHYCPMCGRKFDD